MSNTGEKPIAAAISFVDRPCVHVVLSLMVVIGCAVCFVGDPNIVTACCGLLAQACFVLSCRRMFQTYVRNQKGEH